MTRTILQKDRWATLERVQKLQEIRIAADTHQWITVAAEIFNFCIWFPNRTILSASKRTEAVNYTPAIFPIFAFRIQRNTLDILSMTNAKTTGLVRSRETTTALMVDAQLGTCMRL
jgi:hypothetical protein